MEELLNRIKELMVEKDQPYMYCLAGDYDPFDTDVSGGLDGEGEFRIFWSENYSGTVMNAAYIRAVTLEDGELYFKVEETEESDKFYNSVGDENHITFEQVKRNADPDMLENALKSIIFYLNDDELIEVFREIGIEDIWI